MKKYTIMIVDDNVTNLTVAKQLLSAHYVVIPATSGEKALSLLERVHPDLILLDITMPVMNGFDVIKVLKQDDKTKDIPVIFLTSLDDRGNELEGLELGAVDYIIKPFSAPLLLKRIHIHIDLFNYAHNLENIVTEKTEIIKELQFAIVHTITDLIEKRDGSTGGHIVRTQSFVRVIIDALLRKEHYAKELAELDRDMVFEASQLHDVGKIGIPDAILLKPAKLTQDEYEVMKKHVTIGEEALHKAMNFTRDRKFLEYAAVLAASHHEKWDGTGYPRGLQGDNIPLLGRIMAIADVYDALVSHRPYKLPFTQEQAVEILRKESGISFDPNLIRVFEDIKQEFAAISREMYD